MHLPVCLQNPASSPLTFTSPHPTAVEVSLPSSPSGNPQSSPLGPAPSRTISTSCLPEPLAPPCPPYLRSRTNSCGAEATWACGWRAPCGLAGVSRAWPATVMEAGPPGGARRGLSSRCTGRAGGGGENSGAGEGCVGKEPPKLPRQLFARGAKGLSRRTGHEVQGRAWGAPARRVWAACVETSRLCHQGWE